jgi:hypothetical protein
VTLTRPASRVIVKPLRLRARLSLEGVNIILPTRRGGAHQLLDQAQSPVRPERFHRPRAETLK